MEERASPVHPGTPEVVKMGPNDRIMRLFTALEIPDTWRVAAEAAAADLSRRSRLDLRMSARSNSHLTVRFLGEVADNDVPALIAALEQLHASACELCLGALGTFGTAERTRVVWLGVDGATACLEALAGAVDAALVSAGLALDPQPWRPHLTLARVRERASAAERRALAELVRTLPLPASKPFVADTLALYRSHLGNGPARYELLTQVRFG